MTINFSVVPKFGSTRVSSSDQKPSPSPAAQNKRGQVSLSAYREQGWEADKEGDTVTFTRGGEKHSYKAEGWRKDRISSNGTKAGEHTIYGNKASMSMYEVLGREYSCPEWEPPNILKLLKG